MSSSPKPPSVITTEFEQARRRVIISVIVVFLLAAPVWWRTTEVYRAPLPVADIRAWAKAESLRQTLAVKIDLYFTALPESQNAAHLASTVSSELAALYATPQDSKAETVSPEVGETDVAGDVPVADPEIRLLFDVQSGRGNQYLAANLSNGHYAVQTSCGGSSKVKIRVDAGRTVQIKLPDCSNDAFVTSVLTSTIAGLFADEQLSYRSMIKHPSLANTNTDWENMLTMKYARRYQVTFSLLNADPSHVRVGWDIRDAIKEYVTPFLDSLDDISGFSVHSQTQNYATLPITPQVVNKDGRDLHVIYPDMLPQFINSAQWNLASVVTTAPPLNFILYIPSKAQSPLHVVKANGDVHAANAFLMPRWGGIAIANPPATDGLYHYTVDELVPFMEIFVSQLRDLLGVKRIKIPNADLLLPGAEIEYAESPTTGLTQWEHDRLVRWRTIQNMRDAVQTLNSLATLIQKLESMVVLDVIQHQVLQALTHLRSAHSSLQMNSDNASNHTLASLHARRAITASESAFFDPTMVAMLYFPDEHKYAVYMPLFVPVSVPVIIAVVKEVKRWKDRRRAKKKVRSAVAVDHAKSE
ncbi:hypothetical protein HDU88_007116 [Geranomyces variabilis]|nr:hypothetical protein HDU88_007116 [Geranomyces variabilis]